MRQLKKRRSIKFTCCQVGILSLTARWLAGFLTDCKSQDESYPFLRSYGGSPFCWRSPSCQMLPSLWVHVWQRIWSSTVCRRRVISIGTQESFFLLVLKHVDNFS